MAEKQNRKKRILKHLGNVGIALISFSLMTSPTLALNTTEVASEGGGKVVNEALGGAVKFAKSKPAMSTATGIVCLACIPLAGAAASPGLCIACGILITKTFI